ncbi:MAG: GDP-L-fucose synthase [Eubacteriales bacterium]|nr:GDP-L-fucose synthase [Eubacteriales bacterium]
MDYNAKIYVAGHKGMVGSAIVRDLKSKGYTRIIGRTSEELDLTRQEEVEKFFEMERPEYVFLAAAKVGGIIANSTYPAEFIYKNLMIESNVIHNAYVYHVKKLLFLGSSCIYPRECQQPIKEEYIMTGPLEQTNEAYAVAKIAGLTLCKFYRKQYGCDFISAMPTSLYGENDNFDLESSHVIPALIRKFHEAKANGAGEVIIWGTGEPKREFLHVDDLADACVYLMNQYSDERHINIGSGVELTIAELADLIKSVVGYDGNIIYDPTKPDGTPRKLLDVSVLKEIGWHHRIKLEEGLNRTYSWFRATRQ